MFSKGMVVEQKGVIVEVEQVIDCGSLYPNEPDVQGWYHIIGKRLTKQFEYDKRKWSQAETAIHTPSNPVRILKGAN